MQNLVSERKLLLERFEKTYKNEFKANDFLATQYIGIGVSMMVMFERLDDFQFAKKLVKDNWQLLQQFPSEENLVNYSGSITQILRYDGEYMSTSDREELMSICSSLAKKYGNKSHYVIQKVLDEFGTRVRNQISKNFNQAKAIFELCIEIITKLNPKDQHDKKIQIGQLFEVFFIHHMDKEDYDEVKTLVSLLAKFETTNFIDFALMWDGVNSKMLQEYTIAGNKKDFEKQSKIYEVAEKWMEELNNTSKMDGVFNHIINTTAKRP